MKQLYANGMIMFQILGFSKPIEERGQVLSNGQMPDQVRHDVLVGGKGQAKADLSIPAQVNTSFVPYITSVGKQCLQPMAYGIKLIAVLIFICCLFNNAALAQSHENGGAAERVGEIRPLEIGDTIPEFVWDLSLKKIGTDLSSKSVSLGDYRGKVIILDYWATWCASCIQTMPKMHNLEQMYRDEVVLLPVTYEQEETIVNFVRTTASPQINAIKDEFRTIVDGHLLKDLIPHQTIPHVAIINQQGILEQITKPPFINEEVLAKLIDGEDYYIPVYRETLDKSLLSHTFQDLRQYKPSYYTLLTGHTDGFISPSKEWKDSLDGLSRGYFINKPIIQLLQTNLVADFNMRIPSRRIVDVKDPHAIDWNIAGYQPKDNDWTYEYSLPLDWSIEKIHQYMFDEILELTGLYVQIIKRNMPCLVISRSGANIQKTKHGALKVVIQDVQDKNCGDNAPINYMHARKVSDLVYLLNGSKHTLLPFVVDETGIDYAIDIELPDNLHDIQSWKETLARQGLLLREESREIDVLVITESENNIPVLSKAPLVLTSAGYASKEGVEDE